MREPIIISVIIVNYNGFDYLRNCVESILKAKSCDELEVIIVDNGSDQDASKIKENITNKVVKLIELDKNYGPAYARNKGVNESKGKYLAFLDNDTLVDVNWAENAIEYFEKNVQVGVIQCKLILESDHKRLDYVGEYLGTNGFLVQECKAGDEDIGQFETVKEILAAKSAGMFIRKDVFDLIGGFDEDYFIYVEETDLGWRSWIAGYKAIYLPTSIVYHHFGTSSVILGLDKASTLAKFHGPKNYISTLFKNFETINLIKVLPLHVFLWMGLAAFRLVKGNVNDFMLIMRGILWPVLHFNSLNQKRKSVKKIRVKKDKELFGQLMVSRSLGYYLNKATVTHNVGNAQSF